MGTEESAGALVDGTSGLVWGPAYRRDRRPKRPCKGSGRPEGEDSLVHSRLNQVSTSHLCCLSTVTGMPILLTHS